EGRQFGNDSLVDLDGRDTAFKLITQDPRHRTRAGPDLQDAFAAANHAHDPGGSAVVIKINFVVVLMSHAQLSLLPVHADSIDLTDLRLELTRRQKVMNGSLATRHDVVIIDDDEAAVAKLRVQRIQGDDSGFVKISI